MNRTVDRRTLVVVFAILLLSGFLFSWAGKAELQTEDSKKVSVSVTESRNPHINFEVESELRLGAHTTAIEPVALASADFDSDGITDVVTADAAGSLQLLKGIDPINFAIDPTKKEPSKPEPFSALPTGASLEILADYLFAGDFNADGKQDVLGATKGSSSIVVVIGDGLGHFSRPVRYAIGGTITAVEAGEIGKPDRQADLAVSYSTPQGSFLAVYEHPESAFKYAPEIIKLPSAATAITLGNTDEDFYSDIAVACGTDLVVVHERGQAYPWDIVKGSGIKRPPAVIETRKMPFAIAAMAVGRFGNRRGTSLALLGGDGNIYHLEARKTGVSPRTKLASTMATELKGGPFEPADSVGRTMAVISQERNEIGEFDAYGNPTTSDSERKDPAEMFVERSAKIEDPIVDPEEVKRRIAEDAPRKAAMQKRTKDAFIRGISAKTSSLAKWEVEQITTDHRYSAMAAIGAKLTRASVSDSPFDDLVVTSAMMGQTEIVSRFRGENGKYTVENTVVDGSGGIRAVLPARLNLDGMSDLVVLREGSSAPSVLMSAPSAVFVVNTTADDADCNFGGSCSLRDAIRRANQIGGSSTIYFDLPTAPAVIAPLTPLPAILRPITIQGNHFANGTKKVEISGENMGGAVDGLKIRASNAVIFDLAVTGFKSQTINGSQVGGNGIVFESDSAHPNNTGGLVIDCYLGIDATGTTEKKNMAAGVLIFDSDNNNVARSTLSGNNTGIAIEGGNSNNIQNNIMGLNVAGTAKVPNFRGMFLAGADNLVGGDIAGSPNTISGNGVVSNFAPCVGYGIEVPILVDLTTQELLTHDNNIAGNKLGTDPTGGVGLGNCWQGINAHPLTGTTIGSITESGRNIISGNGHGGVWCEALEYSNPTEGGFCSIMGNNVGTDISGSYSIRNGDYNAPKITSAAGAVLAGTNLSFAAVGAPGGTTQGGPCTGFCNLVSGNAGGDNADVASGIEVGGPGIAGIFNNYIGTKRNGTQELRNQGEGIDMASTIVPDAAPVYFAGGHTEFDGSLGNLVAGNNSSGIFAGPNGGPGEYQIVGNLVGTDVSGTNPIPNSSGIQIQTSFANLVDIGDSDPLGSNVIAGNTFDGINIFSGFGVKIVGNAIGANSSGAPLGNGRNGVTVGGSFAISTIIGGTDATTSNIISNNGKNGVRVNGVTSTYNSIRGNVINNNGQLGIDLSMAPYFGDADGVTPNDDCAKDADLGANRLQNYPVLFTPIYNSNGTVNVTGTLISTPFHHFRIDVYANLVADPTGHGEGRSFLGTAEITLDGNGFGSINWNSLGTAPNGAYISATATDDLGNTSEFSCNAGQSCDGNAAYKDLAEYMALSPLTCPASIVVNIASDEPDVADDQVCDVNTSNSGLQCSLRAALELVNNPSYLGPHEIRFDIPGSGVQTISPATPLPEISKQVQILGDTQPGSETRPMIELNGASQDDTTGLSFAQGSDGSLIRGFIINRFTGSGVILRSNSNTVEKNWIGLMSSGMATDPDQRQRIGVQVIGNDNRVGSNQENDHNFITGNSETGVLVTGSANSNSISGNFIGSFIDKLTYFSGPFTGIKIENGASHNYVGGQVLAANDRSSRNNIAGGTIGIWIVDGANDNFILHNNIGHCLFGIFVNRASGNYIGLERRDTDPTFNIVHDCESGLRFADESLPSSLLKEFPNITEDRKKSLSDPLRSEGRINIDNVTIQTHDNKVSGNVFGGFDYDGAQVPGNDWGVTVLTAEKNEIGTAQSGRLKGGNAMSLNTEAGITLGFNARNNKVRGNIIGLHLTDDIAAGNKTGVQISGDQNELRSNKISGNTTLGVDFISHGEGQDQRPDGNTLILNFIGTNRAGDQAVPNLGHGILITGTANHIGLPAGPNLISGNNENGLVVTKGSTLNTIVGNLIGTDISGQNALANKGVGVWIEGSDNFISQNTISGNGGGDPLLGDGVIIGPYTSETAVPSGNKLEKNRIGTNFDGTSPIPNARSGVRIAGGIAEANGNVFCDGGATGNIIGSTFAGNGNVISGNTRNGVELVCPSVNHNFIRGNMIGTDASGNSLVPNMKDGIWIAQAADNVIGGFGTDIPGARNIISGNHLSGVDIGGQNSAGNRLAGNYIGVGADGQSNLGNGLPGVFIHKGAHNNIIGGPEPEAGNVIKFNPHGIYIHDDAGCCNNVDPNVISQNVGLGIRLGCVGEVGEQEAENMGSCPKGSLPNDDFDFDVGGNKLQNYPDIATYNINPNGDLIVSYRVDSSPGNSSYGFNEGIHVEFFKPDASGQGEKFLNSDQFKYEDFVANGYKTVNLGNAALMGFVLGDRITATATDFEGNTSEFSPSALPTAAEVTISGRVLGAVSGRGIRSAIVMLRDPNGNIRSTASGVRGFYQFENVEAGKTYIISIASRRYHYAARVMQIVDNVADLDFMPEP